jgi:four helix bundle protein
MSVIKTYRELDVYRSAMELTMEIFHMTKAFPAEERYSLTDQIRRSSRSVCANLAEAWRKRRYAAAFVAKLNDSEAEAAETQVWLEIALRSGYLKRETFSRLNDAYDKVLGQLVRMADQPVKWCVGSSKPSRPLPHSPARPLSPQQP